MKFGFFLALLSGSLLVGPSSSLKDRPVVHAWWVPEGAIKPLLCNEQYIDNNAQMSMDQIVAVVQTAADTQCADLGEGKCPKKRAKFARRGLYRGVFSGPCFVSARSK